jgi:lysophospholipase L1-like esterase
MTPPARLRALAMVAHVSALSVVALFIGFGVGRYVTVSSFHTQIDPWIEAESLGGASVGRRGEVARAFKDSKRALAEMDEYIWVAPNVPTPFVGAAPSPGPQINSLQFRSDREIEMPRPEGRFRIFVTGGSVAFSSGAPDLDSTIGGYLETFLNRRSPSGGKRYEVFTFANPSWASTHERIAIENRLTELEPDLIVSISGGNDVAWASQGRNVFWFRSFQGEMFWNLIRIAFEATGAPLTDVVSIGPISPSVVADRLTKNVRLATFAASLAGAQYVFLLQPTLTLAKPPSQRETRLIRRRGEPMHRYTQAVYQHARAQLSALEAEGFRFIDAVDAFSHLTAKDEVFVDLYHLGDRGNEIMARWLVRELGVRPGADRST